MSTLKSTKLYRQLCTVGDRHSLLLIHIRMLTSMSTQKILVSQTYFTSLVAESKAYFATFGKSRSMLRNWLSSSSSSTTSKMDKSNHM